MLVPRPTKNEPLAAQMDLLGFEAAKLADSSSKPSGDGSTFFSSPTSFSMTAARARAGQGEGRRTRRGNVEKYGCTLG